MHRSVERRDVLALAVLSLIGIGIPIWLAAAAGAVGIPTADDWVYMRGAASLFRTGRIDMPAHTAAAIGQLLMVQPLLWLSGGDRWGFTAFGIVMTLVGVVATYLLARRFVGTGSAVMVVLLVEAFPGFARETASFMTDVPAYTLAVLCLLFGTLWLEGGRRLPLVASLAAGVVAVSIREFTIAAPAAVLVVAWARMRPGGRVWLATVSCIFVAASVCVLIVAASIPGRALPAVFLPRLMLIGPVFVTFAAVLLPAVALGVGRRIASLRPEPLILGAGVASFALLLPWASHAGNSWVPNGLGGDLLLRGTRAPLLSAPAWALTAQVASFAAILTAGLALQWAQLNLGGVKSVSTATSLLARVTRRPDGLLVAFLVAYAAQLVIFAPFFVYDRYLYAMVPAAAIVLLRKPAQPSRLGRSHALAHAAFAWLAVSAFLVTANSLAYDSARYREGESAVAIGYDARTVDAGYEWVGYHSSGSVQPGVPAPGMKWNVDRWSLSNPCAVLSNSPLSDGTLTLLRVNRAAYMRYLFFGPPEPLYLYGVSSVECPPLPAAIVGAMAPRE